MDGAEDSQNSSLSKANNQSMPNNVGGNVVQNLTNTSGTQNDADNSKGSAVTQVTSDVPSISNTSNTSNSQNIPSGFTKPKIAKPKKRLLVICGIILGIAVLAGVCVALFMLLSKPEAGPDQLTPEEEQKRSEDNEAIFQDVYNEATSSSNNESAEDVFQQAISAAGNNTGKANAVRVSQMRYLLEQGDYDKIIEVGEQTNGNNDDSVDDMSICDDVSLGLAVRITCHNMMGQAYDYLDEIEQSTHHNNMVSQLVNERARLEKQP